MTIPLTPYTGPDALPLLSGSRGVQALWVLDVQLPGTQVLPCHLPHREGPRRTGSSHTRHKDEAKKCLTNTKVRNLSTYQRLFFNLSAKKLKEKLKTQGFGKSGKNY